MPQLDLIFELLKRDLSAPRTLLEQVVNYIQDHYGYAAGDVHTFFEEKYAQLEDYEVDLTFSPQYTPGTHNRLEYVPLLGDKALTDEHVAALKRRLNESGLHTVFTTPGERDVRVPVHEMFIERFVNLLHLDRPLAPGIYPVIQATVPKQSQTEVNLLARDDAWRKENRGDILHAFLQVFHGRGNFNLPKLTYLTGFVRTYRPEGLADMERQFESMIESCKRDMENVAGRGFADEQLKMEYALNAGDNKGVADDAVWHHYSQMMEMAQLLKEDCQYLPEFATDLWNKAKQCQPA